MEEKKDGYKRCVHSNAKGPRVSLSPKLFSGAAKFTQSRQYEGALSGTCTHTLHSFKGFQHQLQ